MHLGYIEMFVGWFARSYVASVHCQTNLGMLGRSLTTPAMYTASDFRHDLLVWTDNPIDEFLCVLWSRRVKTTVQDRRPHVTQHGNSVLRVERKQKSGSVKGWFGECALVEARSGFGTVVPFFVPRSGFWYRRSVFCTLVPIWGGAREHLPKQPFWKPPFCEPLKEQCTFDWDLSWSLLNCSAQPKRFSVLRVLLTRNSLSELTPNIGYYPAFQQKIRTFNHKMSVQSLKSHRNRIGCVKWWNVKVLFGKVRPDKSPNLYIRNSQISQKLFRKGNSVGSCPEMVTSEIFRMIGGSAEVIGGRRRFIGGHWEVCWSLMGTLIES